MSRTTRNEVEVRQGEWCYVHSVGSRWNQTIRIRFGRTRTSATIRLTKSFATWHGYETWQWDGNGTYVLQYGFNPFTSGHFDIRPDGGGVENTLIVED